jgi:putative OPT family oligopeptide transporter
MIGREMPEAASIYPATVPIATMTAGQIFRGYVRFIGVVKSLRVIGSSFAVAARSFRSGAAAGSRDERSDRDVPVTSLLVGVLLSALAAGLFFSTLGVSLLVALVGLALTLLFSFFFTSVAANAIAITARNPISGMTMLTVIVSSVVLLRFGVSGASGMFFVMALAGVVATALAISGQFVTDLKAGYWLGSTPAAQQKTKFLGVVVAAIAAGLTVAVLAVAFQFGEAAPGDARVVLPSPQAAIMKSLVEGFLSQQPVAWVLFGAGAVVALIMEMLGVPALIFALGMYLPLELNTPALVGGFLSHFLNKRAETKRASLRERGIVIASGLMAGGALGGVFGAALRLLPGYTEDWIRSPFYGDEAVSQTVSALLFVGLCVYVWLAAHGGGRERVANAA